MEIHDYITIINKTKVYPEKTDNFGLAYVFFGLMGELYELKGVTNSTEFKAESSDCIWYITAAALELNLDVIDILNSEPDEATGLVIHMDCGVEPIWGLMEDIKKFYRDGKHIDQAVFTKALKHLMGGLLFIAEEIYGISLESILEYNYNKLMKRRETNTLHGDGSFRENA